MNRSISFNNKKTREFLYEIKPDIKEPFSFNRAQNITRKLGSFVENDTVKFLLWNPVFKDAEWINLEMYVPSSYLNFDKPEQHSTFQYFTFPVLAEGEFAATVIDGAPAGTKNSFGALYEIKVQFNSGETEIIRDPMAHSMPYGIFAPAEIYDLDSALAGRKDAQYFKRLSHTLEPEEDLRISPSVNLLEIHTQTATNRGTLYSLTQRFKHIASKIDEGKKLTPDEENMAGFDAVELMPVDPVMQHPENHEFWDPVNLPKENGDEITVRLRKPVVLNWGYDAVLFGAAAINPSLLTTGRPDELLELIETLHNFPEPIKVVLDVVYGHADHQSLQLLPNEFFRGAGIYGQEINLRHPMVRALILEMQRRKINYGFDGVRVDGAQDFKYYDHAKEKMLNDDNFLRLMSNIKQQAAGIEYRPWMIFEDGRPWPRKDWKLAATYREVTRNQPYAFQWAPIIFAYNTPYTYTYWVKKWWRMQELLSYGERWITGYANHDTIRRGVQTDPELADVNMQLGNSLKMIGNNAYNSPATTLLMHGFMPGVPMDFLQALGNTPWSFIRDTDTTYAMKILADEAYFLRWQVTENEFRQARFFKHIKYMGFTSLEELRRFTETLRLFIKATNIEPDGIAVMLNQIEPRFEIPDWDQEKLHKFVTSWMHDLNDYCNVDSHSKYVDKKKAHFNLDVRKFRHQNAWLKNNFGQSDFLSYVTPVEGTVIYYGKRKNPESGREIIFIANMEGHPRQVLPSKLLSVDNPEKWTLACVTPSLTPKKIQEPIRLSISQGIMFVKD